MSQRPQKRKLFASSLKDTLVKHRSAAAHPAPQLSAHLKSDDHKSTNQHAKENDGHPPQEERVPPPHGGGGGGGHGETPAESDGEVRVKVVTGELKGLARN